MQDIYSTIFTHITDFKPHINFGFVNTSTYAASRQYICTIPKAICEKILVDSIFNNIVLQFSLIRCLYLCNTNAIDVSTIVNCHTLYLYYTDVTDVSTLGNCHTLYLYYTDVTVIDKQTLIDSGVNITQ